MRKKKEETASRNFDVRVRETVIRSYSVTAKDEDEAREIYDQDTHPIEVDRVDWEVESVKEVR